jgi:putative transposase
MHKAFKYRIYPNAKQRELFSKSFGCTRFVFNHFLRRRMDQYAATGTGMNYPATNLELTELKKLPDTEWLKEVNSQSLQSSLRDLDAAYNNFFNKRTEFPNFKKKQGHQSFQVPQHFSLNGNRLSIPKTAPIRIVVHRPLEGKPKQVTISKNAAGEYYASIHCEVAITEPEYKGTEIGIDLGLSSFLITSSGEKVDPGNHYRVAEKKLAKLQRRLSKKKKGSKNRIKAKAAVAKHHQKISNQRTDFQNRLSLRLVHENQVIHTEDLSVKNMVKNHNLAKSISDAGWSEFLRQLEYKGSWYGCHINKVDQFFPSSKRCSCCGYVMTKLPLHIRSWKCPECSTRHDRDINAANNILIFGRAGAARSSASAQKACGDASGGGTKPSRKTKSRSTSQASKKQEARLLAAG